jgi:hypothetical protein
VKDLPEELVVDVHSGAMLQVGLVFSTLTSEAALIHDVR